MKNTPIGIEPMKLNKFNALPLSYSVISGIVRVCKRETTPCSISFRDSSPWSSKKIEN